MSAETLVQPLYLISTALFILSLRWMSDPETARKGVMSGVAAMTLAVLGTLTGVIATGGTHYWWILAAFAAGAAVGYPLAQVPLTAVPQRTALSHAFGGLAAGLVGTAKFFLYYGQRNEAALAPFIVIALVAEILLGFLTFTGSILAAGKLQEAQQDLRHQGNDDEGGQGRLVALPVVEEELGRAHQTGGQAAESMGEGGPLGDRREGHLGQGVAHRRTRGEGGENPPVVGATGGDDAGEGAHHRQGHGRHAGHDALARGFGIAHPPQRQDEEGGGDEVEKLDEGLGAHFATFSCFLNIFSMRSVMRKPLTMLVVEQKMAIRPRAVM